MTDEMFREFSPVSRKMTMSCVVNCGTSSSSK